MFGGPPPPPSAEEKKAQEDAARATVYGALSACAMLYLSPFLVDYVKNLV